MKMWIILFLALLAFLPFFVRAGVLEKLLMSNKSYAKNIEVKTYVLTQEQVADLFKYPEKEPEQLTVEDFYKIQMVKKPRYFVVRVRNLGDLHAWGTLSCKVKCIHKPFKIPMISIRKQFCNYVICIDGFSVSSGKDSPYPEMSYEWSELYTK